MDLQTLNAALSGGLKATEIVTSVKRSHGTVVAYRRANPTFPGRPFVVHTVRNGSAVQGDYDIATAEEAARLAQERF